MADKIPISRDGRSAGYVVAYSPRRHRRARRLVLLLVFTAPFIAAIIKTVTR